MKTITKLFANLFKVVVALLIITLLSPALYFAWRAGQPMDLPEFKGLTYYQYLEWRRMAHYDLAVKYQAAHPDEEVKLELCETGARTITFTVTVEQSLWYTFWSWRDENNRIAMLTVDYPAPDELVTSWNFMPSWWRSYEKLILSLAQYEPQQAVVYCRLQPNIPTFEEFEAMTLQEEMGMKP